MAIIEARDLVKVFERTRRAEGRFATVRTLVTRQKDRTVAVDGVSLSIDEGEVVGYLGPNGAGKSTTIKMLTGILVPTSGTATVAGVVPWDDREANAMNIGVVFGQRSQLWWDLPLDESFRLIGKMYRVPEARFRQTLEMLGGADKRRRIWPKRIACDVIARGRTDPSTSSDAAYRAGSGSPLRIHGVAGGIRSRSTINTVSVSRGRTTAPGR